MPEFRRRSGRRANRLSGTTAVKVRATAGGDVETVGSFRSWCRALDRPAAAMADDSSNDWIQTASCAG